MLPSYSLSIPYTWLVPNTCLPHAHSVHSPSMQTVYSVALIQTNLCNHFIGCRIYKVHLHSVMPHVCMQNVRTIGPKSKMLIQILSKVEIFWIGGCLGTCKGFARVLDELRTITHSKMVIFHGILSKTKGKCSLLGACTDMYRAYI